MIFEIINPSDKYTMEADDWQVAAVAGLLIGRGRYGVEGCDNDHEMPIFLFGGLDEWLQEEFGMTQDELSNFIDKNVAEVADCLDSVMIGRMSDRESFKRASNSLLIQMPR